MSEFQRKPDSDNIFENNEMVTIILRYHSSQPKKFERNQNNSLSFSKIKEILESSNECYWQKQKDYEGTNKSTGAPRAESTHKIIVPIGTDKAIHAIVRLYRKIINDFDTEFSYKIIKIKEIAFIRPPTNNVIIIRTSFILHVFESAGDISLNSNFQSLYKNIQLLGIPTVDVNKESDKQIWDNYIVALRKLVKRKEQVWKINSTSPPYMKRTGGGKREMFIDIFINEKNLAEQFGKEIVSEIGESRLEDWNVNDTDAFFELNNYSVLNSTTIDNIRSIGTEYFYEMTQESPRNFLSGSITFTYADEDERTSIYEQIEGLLLEYKIEATIDENGKINISKTDLKYLQKIVTDNFGEILEVKEDTGVSLKVALDAPTNLDSLKSQADHILKSVKGFNKYNIELVNQGQSIVVEIGTALDENTFDSISLDFQKALHKIKPKIDKALALVDGTTISGRYYEFSVSNRKELYLIVDKINRANSTNIPYYEYAKKWTKYYFDYSNLEQLKQLKLALEGGKNKFDIVSSMLTLNPVDSNDYYSQVSKIKALPFNISVEKKDFSPDYFVQFSNEIISIRERALNSIQNDINNDATIHIDTEILGKFSKLIFTFEFVDESERDLTKELIIEAQSKFIDVTLLTFENALGRTSYELTKNEELEANKIKEIGRGIHRASFVLLDEEEKQRFEKEKKRWGDDDRFRGGINIGKLTQKKGNKFVFKLDETFDSHLNAVKDKRLEIADLPNRYIKPIFIGELVNIGRMLTAMKKVTDPEGRNGSAVNPNLSNFIFDSSEAREGSLNLGEVKEEIQNNLIESNLNDKQIEAVAKSISSTDMTLIQGPPGTGKTTVIAEIIWQTLNLNPDAKILITSQTNLAVDNAIERLTGKRIVRPLRIGNIDKFENEGRVYSVDRINTWLNSDPGSPKETETSNNAIEDWIVNIHNNCSTEGKYEKAVSKWRKRLLERSPDIKEAFHDAYKKHINVFAATCSECGSSRFRSTYNDIYDQGSSMNVQIEFDLVIMDEASKATPPELILPLTFGKKIVILGDHKQLPPMLDEKEFGETLESVGLKSLVETWTREDYKISQFEKLFNRAVPSIVSSLDTQYRMHEQIMNCVAQFYKDQEEYENGLLCGIKDSMDIPDLSNKGSRYHGLTLEPFLNPNIHAIWVNVSTPESTIGTGTSYKNDGEVAALKLVMNNLTKASGFSDYYSSLEKEEEKEIGVISFYMPQMQSIKKALYPNLSIQQLRDFERFKFDNEYNIPFRINTVDRFQGMERNILIISTVRSDSQVFEKKGSIRTRPNTNYPRALGFAKEYQRINVGLSRAKRLLIVIGNQKHFEHRAEYAEAIRKMHVIDVKQLENLI
jgi:superfamily I DNA and/or RNA helicase